MGLHKLGCVLALLLFAALAISNDAHGKSNLLAYISDSANAFACILGWRRSAAYLKSTVSIIELIYISGSTRGIQKASLQATWPSLARSVRPPFTEKLAVGDIAIVNSLTKHAAVLHHRQAGNKVAGRYQGTIGRHSHSGDRGRLSRFPWRR